MRLYLNFHTYNDKSEMDYLIYGEIPASSTPRQIPPVDSIYRPRFSYRYSKHFEGRKVGFWRIFSGTDWQYVKLNNFNLRTYNDKSEMDYLIYGEIPASSTPRQIPPVDSIYRPRFSYRYSKHFEGRKVGFWRIFSGTDWQYVKLNNFNLRT